MDMDKDQESPKKCFCARCFLPIEPEDKVDIDGQNFHRVCSMCCICRTIPTSLKMFYGHVFCNECFKNHVLSRFKGESPRMHSNSWWMQWAPGVKPPQQQRENEKDENAQNADHTEKPETDEKEKDKETCKEKSDPAKKCICARCLQAVDEAHKVDIGGQSFHPQCARCYFCHCVPKDNVKIYYGQVFCEDCFHRHVLNRNRDNPMAEQRAVCGAHERFLGWERAGSVHLHDAAGAAGCAPAVLRMRHEPTPETPKTGVVPDERERNEEMCVRV
ncbi:cysteine and glycine-rich protein 2-like isoform X3 [Hyposmocoma kahamanoa]|uniref:cysteine and glycine-rich protein 2-like isoform X3 n=1 Tax=Hyposmocoma kahamanoa TaxID=1477025 RepID=UPI000E6D8B04|nr:cysteine and glycine-rich protein 2-like isoform X3 [Hyposmocoma kahamanoa]